MNIQSSWRYIQTAQTKSATSATQLLSQPNEVIASENMVTFSFTPYEVNVSAVYAKLVISVNGSVAINEVITIESSAGISSILTAKTTPNVNEFYTPVSGSFANRVLVAEQIANELINNLAISELYNISTDDFYVIIEAKNYGDDYNLTFTPSASITQFSNVAGTDKYSYTSFIDYSTFIETYIGPITNAPEFGGDVDKYLFSLVSTSTIPFSSEVSRINVCEVIKNYVDVVLPTKKQNVGFAVKQMDKVTNTTPILRPYFLVWGDNKRYVTNGDLKQSLQGVTAIRWVQNAALHKLNLYDLSKYILHPGNVTTFKILTNKGTYIPVTYTSQMYIGFIFRKYSKATGTIGLRVTLNYLDGSNDVFTIGNYDYSLLSGNISIDVSPNVLNLQFKEQLSGQNINNYTVEVTWTVGSNTYYSEPSYYVMQNKCNDISENIIWFNSYGAWDSFEFNGTQIKQIKRDTKMFEREIPFNANSGSGNVSFAASSEVALTHKIDHDINYTINSGYVSADLYDYFNGLSKSTAIYIWDTIQKQYVSIYITEFDLTYSSKQSEINCRIVYKYTVDSNTITR